MDDCPVIVSYFCFTEGVLAQETDRNVTKFGSQLIAATYVKFIESAGGRMVPILYPLLLWPTCNHVLVNSLLRCKITWNMKQL